MLKSVFSVIAGIVFFQSCLEIEFKKSPKFYKDTSSKTQIACPKQTNKTVVVFAFGQSNSANYGQKRYENQDARIVNFFNGKCYIAQDPILGAENKNGSVWVPMAQKLTEDTDADYVIISASGIGGQAISNFVKGGNKYAYIQSALFNIEQQYSVTHVLYHQGESDHATPYLTYLNALKNIIGWVQEETQAQIYVAKTSRCVVDSAPHIIRAQEDVADDLTVFLGPDTDALVPLAARYDGCHFGEEAQASVGNAWADIIALRRTPQ